MRMLASGHANTAITKACNSNNWCGLLETVLSQVCTRHMIVYATQRLRDINSLSIFLLFFSLLSCEKQNYLDGNICHCQRYATHWQSPLIACLSSLVFELIFLLWLFVIDHARSGNFKCWTIYFTLQMVGVGWA